MRGVAQADLRSLALALVTLRQVTAPRRDQILAESPDNTRLPNPTMTFMLKRSVTTSIGTAAPLADHVVVVEVLVTPASRAGVHPFTCPGIP
jgi:hypothetical protein